MQTDLYRIMQRILTQHNIAYNVLEKLSATYKIAHGHEK